MKIAKIILKYLEQAEQEIEATCPPPYKFPSNDGRAAHILHTAINSLKCIVKPEIRKTTPE